MLVHSRSIFCVSIKYFSIFDFLLFHICFLLNGPLFAVPSLYSNCNVTSMVHSMRWFIFWYDYCMRSQNTTYNPNISLKIVALNAHCEPLCTTNGSNGSNGFLHNFMRACAHSIVATESLMKRRCRLKGRMGTRTSLNIIKWIRMILRYDSVAFISMLFYTFAWRNIFREFRFILFSMSAHSKPKKRKKNAKSNIA